MAQNDLRYLYTWLRMISDIFIHCSESSPISLYLAQNDLIVSMMVMWEISWWLGQSIVPRKVRIGALATEQPPSYRMLFLFSGRVTVISHAVVTKIVFTRGNGDKTASLDVYYNTESKLNMPIVP